MKIITYAAYEWDGKQYFPVEEVCMEWAGPIALCKGDNSKAEMQRANEISAGQLAIQQQQLHMQQQQLAAVNAQLDPMIQAGGMLPSQQSALTSIMMNQLPAQFNSAVGQINQNLAARGISGGQYGSGSGDIARDFGSLGAMEAGMQAQGLNAIQLQKQQQLMNALNTKLGIGGMYGSNIGTFGQGGIGALNSGVAAANNADAAATSWMGPLFGALGSIGSAGIGKIPCWIATELYGGWLHPDTVSVRTWFSKHPILQAIYRLVGIQWAEIIKTHRVLRRITKYVFDWILKKAIHAGY